MLFLNCYKRALDVILKKPIMLWGLSLLLSIVTAIGTSVTFSIPFLSMAVSFLFTCGAVKLYMDGLEGRKVNSKQLFFAFNKNCVKTAGAMAWQALWTVIWFMVPIAGIVKFYSYRFVPYIIVTHPEVSAFDALKISMRMTKGKKGQMFLADLIFIAAPVVVALIIGLISGGCYEIGIRVLGDLFSLVTILFGIAYALFGTIFSGLYQAAFFNEEEVAGHIAYLEAENYVAQ